jgi:hypothetical protein
MDNTELAVMPPKQLSNSRLDDSLFSKDLAPHYMKLAGQLATSELVPKSFRGKPQDLFICWAMGYQVGLSPEQAMQCIAVINGKPAMWGDDMLALCMTHPDFIDMVEEPIMLKDNTVFGYTCTVKRKGMADKVNKFTLEMAKRAGLLARGDTWAKYPERMLKLRARGFSLRDAFPDALKGIKPREEVEDYIDADYKMVDDKDLSRTELLKKDYLTKTGRVKHEEVPEQSESEVHSVVIETAEEDQEPEDKDSAREDEAEIHSQIRRLIDEKGFTEERLVKALAYYEVEGIDALTTESGIHFINQLLKL